MTRNHGKWTLFAITRRGVHTGSMSIRIGMVTVDTRDSQKLALWWAEQLEGTVEAYSDLGETVDPHSPDAKGAFFIVSTPERIPLGFQQVPDPTEGKNRLHLDLNSTDRAAEISRLVAAGATLLYEMSFWSTLADPDGNQFCVSDLAMS